MNWIYHWLWSGALRTIHESCACGGRKGIRKTGGAGRRCCGYKIWLLPGLIILQRLCGILRPCRDAGNNRSNILPGRQIPYRLHNLCHPWTMCNVRGSNRLEPGTGSCLWCTWWKKGIHKKSGKTCFIQKQWLNQVCWRLNAGVAAEVLQKQKEMRDVLKKILFLHKQISSWN